MSSSLKKNNPESALTCVDRDHAFFGQKSLIPIINLN